MPTKPALRTKTEEKGYDAKMLTMWVVITKLGKYRHWQETALPWTIIHSGPDIWTVPTCSWWSETRSWSLGQKLSTHTWGTKTKNRWRRRRETSLWELRCSSSSQLESSCSNVNLWPGWAEREERGLDWAHCTKLRVQHNTGQPSVNKDINRDMVTINWTAIMPTLVTQIVTRKIKQSWFKMWSLILLVTFLHIQFTSFFSLN